MQQMAPELVRSPVDAAGDLPPAAGRGLCNDITAIAMPPCLANEASSCEGRGGRSP